MRRAEMNWGGPYADGCGYKISNRLRIDSLIDRVLLVYNV